MVLSKRLAAVASFVPEGSRLADVGTDHGYIPISLVRDKTVPHAIAMDVREGPLGRAAENVLRYGLEEQIELRLSDGLDALACNEADTVVISGLGGPLMREILSRGRQVAGTVNCFVLSPQSDIPGVRIYLRENGYRIRREAFIEEEGKHYTVMQVFHGESRPGRYIDDLYGRYLLDTADPVLAAWLKRQAQRLRTLAPALLTSPREETRAQGKRLMDELARVEEALGVMTGQSQ